jgi:hypothetical protein
MALFALSNGLGSTLAMIYGPQSVPHELKDRAGYLMAASLILGLFSGFCTALLFTYVQDYN